jgi:hypothetical protein
LILELNIGGNQNQKMPFRINFSTYRSPDFFGKDPFPNFIQHEKNGTKKKQRCPSLLF